MSIRFIFRSLLGMCLLSAAGMAAGDDKASTEALQKVLSKKILKPDQTLKEVRAFCRGGLIPLPQPQSVADWEKYASNLRQEIFNNVIYRGEAARWKDLPTEPVWQDTIAGGPGYSIRKLRFEAVPGMWVPALLYVPDKLSGKVPVVMAVNGHDRNGKSADYKQARCINLVKRGLIVLNLEWLNMGQLRSPDFGHGRMNQLDLCGTSGIAPFYLSMKRGLDILLSHPNADATRVAVSGLSGGGWQTIFISSLDTRVTLCNPVAGYSAVSTRIDHHKDLGDSEQAPDDMAKYADYSLLTALLAPRAALLTYNAKDECCFEAGYALPPLLAAAAPFYKLYGKPQYLRSHINHDPGTHNYLKENREAYYKLIGDFFFAGDKSYIYPEIPYEKELKTAAELNVPLPEKNAGFNTLALQIAQNLPRDASLPTGDAASIRKWQSERQRQLDKLLALSENEAKFSAIDPDTMSGDSVKFAAAGKESPLQIEARFGIFQVILEQRNSPTNSHSRSGLSLVATEAMPSTWGRSTGHPRDTLILGDQGRSSLAEPVLAVLRQHERAIAVDLPGFGECAVPRQQWLYEVLLSSQGRRPLGLASGRLVSQVISHGCDEKTGRTVKIVAKGPRVGIISLVALSQLPTTKHPHCVEGLELHDCYGSLKELLEKNVDVENAPELFCFSLLEQFDVLQLAALCAPTPVTFVNPSEKMRKDLAPLKAVYKALGSDHDPLPPSKK